MVMQSSCAAAVEHKPIENARSINKFFISSTTHHLQNKTCLQIKLMHGIVKVDLVPKAGLEPARLAAGDFVSPASTIPPLGPIDFVELSAFLLS